MAAEVKPNVFARFGNDLHSGARSYPFIGKRRLWLLLAVLLMAVSVAIPLVVVDLTWVLISVAAQNLWYLEPLTLRYLRAKTP